MPRPVRAFLALAIFSPLLAFAADGPLKVIVFPGGFNWPIWVAQEKGFFKDNGVAVELTPTPSSVFQLVGLIEGKFDIAITAIDNLIAYRDARARSRAWAPT